MEQLGDELATIKHKADHFRRMIVQLHMMIIITTGHYAITLSNGGGRG